MAEAVRQEEASEKRTKLKKEKKAKKRRREDTSHDAEPDVDKKKKSRQDRKMEKTELLRKVPTKDEHGIAYTKLQIRRMMKRVKRGLPPVPTEAEEQERLRNEAQLRKEEEQELAGMLYQKDDVKPEESSGGNEQSGGDDDDDEVGEEEQDEEQEEAGVGNTKHVSSPTKKTQRSKPVPEDYVCQACKNKHQPVHWIYDCPDKVTVRGTNKKKKKDRGFVEPDARKVFVSGLPFDLKPSDVEKMFQGCGKVTTCKLIKFEDTGRCKGQAYIGFETESGAKQALKLSGTSIKSDISENKKKTKAESAGKRKELKLKVTKMMDRRATKNSRSSIKELR